MLGLVLLNHIEKPLMDFVTSSEYKRLTGYVLLARIAATSNYVRVLKYNKSVYTLAGISIQDVMFAFLGEIILI